MNPIGNWQFYLTYRCISTSLNQIHLDCCRKMIEMWFLSNRQYAKANDLYNHIQVRECQLLAKEMESIENENI
jgi:hypothetical protein